MLARRLRMFFWFPVLLLAAATAGATVLRSLALPEVVGESDRVVVATVRSTSAAFAADGMIRTEVVFDRISVLKGPPAGETLALDFAGGRIGNRRLHVVGIPEFTIGNRHVLFVAEGVDPLCPTVGWSQGCYRLSPHPSTGEESVHDANGRPVYGFAEGRPVVELPPGGGPPLAAAEFLDRIRALVLEQAEPGGVTPMPGAGEEAR